MPEEREFEVIDKRRVSAEGAGAAPATGSAEGDADRGATEARASQTEAGSADLQANEEVGPERGAPSGGISEEELRAAMEEAGMGEGGAMPPLDVPGTLSFCVSLLHEVAWMKMGLVPSPVSRQIERDLAQAKVAIDAVGDLVARLEPLVEGPARRELQVMLSNLRINFVQQSQRSG